MKALVLAGAVVLAGAAVAGNVCRWTGEAYDGKWSSTANWEDSLAPRSGYDDVVYIPGGATIDIDKTSFSIGRLLIEGSGETVVRGGLLKLEVTGVVLSNDTATVTIENDILVSQNSRFYTSTGDITVKGNVTIAAGMTLYVETPDIPQGTILLLGGVEGPEATLNMRLGQNATQTRMHHMRSAFNVKSLVVGGDYRTANFQLHAFGQQWQEVTVGYGSLIAMEPGIYCPTTVIRPNSYYATGNYNLNGFDQTVDRIDPGTGTDNGAVRIVSAEPATLTMRATGNGSFGGQVNDRASLVWHPVGSSTFTATGVSGTTGSLTVSNGTFVVGGSGSFASARSLTVAEGAIFSLETDAANALAGLRSVRLDGTLVIGENAETPFAGVIVTVGASGKITVPAGKSVTVGAIRVNGELIADDTYETADWLTPDGGSVKVDSTTLPDEFIWKDPVSGSWDTAALWQGNQAPDGSRDVSVTVLGGDYAVTMPDATSLTKPLTVGNASGSGMASVVAEGTLALSGGSSLAVGRGGKVSIPAGTSLTLTGNSGTASTARVIDVSDGGELAVVGDFLADNLYGLISVSGGGRISVTDGLFKCVPHSSGAGDVWNNRIDVGTGGRIDVSGGVFYPSIGSWGNCGIRFTGGELNVSNEGRLRFKADTQLVLGYGRIVLSGDAVADIENNGGANVWTQAGGNTSAGWWTNGETLSLVVTDRASLAFGSTMFYFGYDRWSVNTAAINEFIYESSATSSFQSFSLGANPYRGSSVRAVLGSGQINVGNYGLLLNRTEVSYLSTQNQLLSGGAVFSVTGGVLQVTGRYREYGGLQIGSALPWSVSVPNRLDGRLEISDGKVKNDQGSIVLGSGNAKGVIRMTGGTFSSTGRPAFFGVGDGEGRFEMTGGTANFSEAIYLGIGETVAGLAYFSSEAERAKFSFGKTLDHCAKGVLDIEGGSFTTTSNIVCGVDGDHGEILVGPTGTIAAKDLCMSNAADVITVRIDGANGGAINLSGKLDVAAGVKLRIVGAETIPEGMKPLKILSFASKTRDFAELDIEVADGVPVIQTPTGVRVGNPRGLMLILR